MSLFTNAAVFCLSVAFLIMKKINDTKITFNRISQVVNLISGVDIRIENREPIYSNNRWIFFVLCREIIPKKDAPLDKIAKYCGVTHATVIHGINQFNNPSIFVDLRTNYYKCVAILEMIESIKFTLPVEIRAPREYKDYSNNIMGKVQELINDYENKVEFYKHDFFRDFPNIFKIFTEFTNEEMNLFENTRAKPYLKMRHHGKTT